MAVYSFRLCSQGLESSMQDSTVSGKVAKLIAAHPHATIIKHESHVTDEDLWRLISCTLDKHAPGNTHIYICPRQTHGVQHVYWCYCMPLQSCLNTYTIAPSTDMDACPAPACHKRANDDVRVRLRKKTSSQSPHRNSPGLTSARRIGTARSIKSDRPCR